MTEMTVNDKQLRKEADVLKTDDTTDIGVMKDEIGHLRTKVNADVIKAQLKIENDETKEHAGTSKSQSSTETKFKLKVSQ